MITTHKTAITAMRIYLSKELEVSFGVVPLLPPLWSPEFILPLVGGLLSVAVWAL